MSETGTIILTAPQQDLLGAIVPICLTCAWLTIDRSPPDGQVLPPAWCFVDWLLPDISGLEMCQPAPRGPDHCRQPHHPGARR